MVDINSNSYKMLIKKNKKFCEYCGDKNFVFLYGIPVDEKDGKFFVQEICCSLECCKNFVVKHYNNFFYKNSCTLLSRMEHFLSKEKKIFQIKNSP